LISVWREYPITRSRTVTEVTIFEHFLLREELRAGGATSLRAIAAGLEERGIPAARGGKWSAVQVMRLLEAGRPFDGASVAAA
jgi:hypothetical protein